MSNSAEKLLTRLVGTYHGQRPPLVAFGAHQWSHCFGIRGEWPSKITSGTCLSLVQSAMHGLWVPNSRCVLNAASYILYRKAPTASWVC